MSVMLGRLRRTRPIDVGLAICFAGLAYLVWAMVAGVSREVVQEMIKSTAVTALPLPELTRMVKVFFVDAGFVIDLVGLGWLAFSLALVVLSSRQGEIVISVTDEGFGVDPDDLPDPLDEKNLLKPSGRGLFVVKSLVDRIQFSFSPGGETTVIVYKKV